MGTLGAHVVVNPWKWMTLQSAAFQGNVFAQNVNRHGFRWDLNEDLGYFWINELQVRWNAGTRTRAGFLARQSLARGSRRLILPILFLTTAACRWLTKLHREPGNSRLVLRILLDLDQMLYREPGKSEVMAGLSKDGKSVAPAKESKQTEEKPSSQDLGWFGRIAFEPQDRKFARLLF